MSLFRDIERIFDEIWIRKVPFLAVFFWVAFLTYGFFTLIDFVPEPISTPERSTSSAPAAETTESEVGTGEAAGTAADPTSVSTDDPSPDRIIIDKLDRSVEILNPESRSIEVLDNALLSGVVRHPDSANLIEDGTVFLFGHSSSLPNVINRNFQAFNGIQTLEWGDIVRLQSADTEYVYRVDSVYQVKASEASVDIQRGRPSLTLATCNSFGTKDDRHIVEATLIETKTL